jgi:DNA repair protein RecO (recombination protein O)
MSQESRETAGIVLDSREHGESDKIITLYTRNSGRITGIAKGANKSKKRFLNKLELFSYISLSYSANKRSTLVFIADAELHSSFIAIRRKVDCYNAATFIRETLLIATTDGEGDPEIFALLHWALQSLDLGKSCLDICTIFLLRLFDRLGYRPDFTHCCICDKPFDLELHYIFSHHSGGLVCSSCEDMVTGGSIDLTAGTIRILRSALIEPIERLHRLKFSRQALRQSLPMLHRYARNLFQRDIHSWKAVRNMLN